MYQIGLFSKMNQITIKTLHHYDDIGLLKPARIDKNTGYRYYSSSQSYDLYRIRFLKQLDFSLEDIQKMLDGESKEVFLLQKKEELLRDIADKAKMLGQIDYYLTQSQQEDQGYEVLIKTIPACIVLSRRLTIDKYADLFKEMIQMEKVLSELKCKKTTPNYCFNSYHNQEYKESDVDVEICEAVTKAQQNIDDYNFLSLNQIDNAACVIHKGSYNELPNAYYALTTWIEKNHYEINGLPRESYIEGKWSGIDESEWLTEIQFPVRKNNSII